MTKRGTALIVIVVMLVGALAFAGRFSWTWPSWAARALPTATASAPATPAAPLADFETALEGVYTRVSPSVVAIQVVQKQAVDMLPIPEIPGFPLSGPPVSKNPRRQYQYRQGLGSGFVWDRDGHIVTNNHVVAGADRIAVVFDDGTTVPGKVVGEDAHSDLAVIQVNVPSGRLQPVTLAESTDVKVGQLAIAIGNPFGQQNTMTTGIVSGIGRSLPATDGTPQGPTYTIPDVIQTDAPINPGNSGGVLLDDTGRVIGVTAAIESPVGASAGVGFAIPSAIAQRVVPSLIRTGRYQHPWLGISGVSLTPDLARAAGLPADERGAMIVDVMPGSPADRAHLHRSARQLTIDGERTRVGGDVIVAMSGVPVKSFDDVVAYLARTTSVGQTLTLTVLRDGRTLQVAVVLAARPAQQ